MLYEDWIEPSYCYYRERTYFSRNDNHFHMTNFTLIGSSYWDGGGDKWRGRDEQLRDVCFVDHGWSDKFELKTTDALILNYFFDEKQTNKPGG